MSSDSSVPRAEYPRPQFQREDWMCLNGEWEFETDSGDSGLDRGILDRDLKQKILVPFCPESELSGIGCVDYMDVVWYRRTVEIPSAWSGRNVLLHFQAVDYDATVWVNGNEVGRHRGGFSPFACDLSGVAGPGETATIVVRARDNHRLAKPKGKQVPSYSNRGCLYTRTTGIWQSVWMEPVPECALGRPRITPDVTRSRFSIEQSLSKVRPGLQLKVSIQDGEGEVAARTVDVGLDMTPCVDIALPSDRCRLWSTDDPHLYDLRIELQDADGTVLDSVKSYAGLRSVSIDGMAVKINGKSVFQRLVLDQGYYPDGIMTAPSDEALLKDIELSIAAGFNGARLHQKVFEERFLYHADRLGYLVWGEFGDWGWCERRNGVPIDGPPATFMTQWLEVLERDYSHPSIIGWCPLNETHQKDLDRITVLDDVTIGMYVATKAADRTRPVLDASGYTHRVPGADIYDCHDYTQEPRAFADRQSGLAKGEPLTNTRSGGVHSVPYRGQPYFVSEFGGIWWNPEAAKGEDSWGYGDRPKSVEEFYERFKGLCDVLLDDPNMFGYCYTQLTDVFQEQNGIFHFDRREKFDMDRIRAAQIRQAAIESGDE